MCVIDDPDFYCSVWREDTRKARKRHRCSCCRSAILPGETYIDHFSIVDGSADNEKLCGECTVARAAFSEAHGGVVQSPSYFPVLLSDCVSEGDDDDQRWYEMLRSIQDKRKAVKGGKVAEVIEPNPRSDEEGGVA